MEERVAAIRAGSAPELVWLLEHPPLYTAGTSARVQDLLAPQRFPVFDAGRGGQYTYHGPGQRVAYVMLDLQRRQPDLRRYIWQLEEWVIRTLAQFNVRGDRRAGRGNRSVDDRSGRAGGRNGRPERHRQLAGEHQRGRRDEEGERPDAPAGQA